MYIHVYTHTIGELQAASVENGSSSSNIGGVLELLVALLSPSKGVSAEENAVDILQILYEDYDILKILLVNCLGLVPVSNMEVYMYIYIYIYIYKHNIYVYIYYICIYVLLYIYICMYTCKYMNI
jgi:hypothetical protein